MTINHSVFKISFVNSVFTSRGVEYLKHVFNLVV